MRLEPINVDYPVTIMSCGRTVAIYEGMLVTSGVTGATLAETRAGQLGKRDRGKREIGEWGKGK